jgi:hypothetical protein
MSLAELNIEEHRTAEAERFLSLVREEFRSQRNTSGEAWGLRIAARARMESGNINGAIAAVNAAKQLATHDVL